MGWKTATLEWDDAALRFAGSEQVQVFQDTPQVHSLLRAFLGELVRSGLKPTPLWIKTVISLTVVLACLIGGFLLLGSRQTEIIGMIIIGVTPFGMFLFLMLACRAVRRSDKVNQFLKLKLQSYQLQFKSIGYDLNCVFQEGKYLIKLSSSRL